MNLKKEIETTRLIADWRTLIRTFVRPESDAAKSSLLKYMEQILFELYDFLQQNVGITEEMSLKAMSEEYKDTRISRTPEMKLPEVISDLIQNVAPHAVNVSSPYFIGHMTSAIPFFMVHLKTIVAALNQNVVKMETSKVFSVVERQVTAKVHRLVYGLSDAFYEENVHDTAGTLGIFTEGGTTANMTAMWVARNRVFAPKEGFAGVEAEGLAAACRAYGADRAVILVSRRAHYSFRKAGGLLGIGNRNIISVDVDDNNRMDLSALTGTIAQLREGGRTKILAVVGIAGTTETGNVDPLTEIAGICREEGIHFHVDAAWGGPTMVSEKYGHLLAGIELADSVTIDGHKQFYMPMGCGMVFFRNPQCADAISYHANYVNREGSVDLGIKSLAGSREANSMVLHCALKIMGTGGYALLIDHGIELARSFAAEIEERPDFQLVTAPELNLLTYRVCPAEVQEVLVSGTVKQRKRLNERLNELNKAVQRKQREAGNSFVSRTVLRDFALSDECVVVFRCVLMNPMTDMTILRDILDEQQEIYGDMFNAFVRLD